MTIIDADKLDEIIVDAIDASTNKVECQTLRWVLDRISEVSSVTPRVETCEDYISRAYIEPIVEELENICINGDEYILLLLSNIKNAPSVTPLPKTGHWIRWYEQKENDGCIEHIPHCKCSECGKEYDPYSSQFVKYCNKCGTKMEEEE